MLKLFLALLALFGYVPKGPTDAFTLLEQGNYKEAIQLINVSKYYDVLKALNSKEQTLLTGVIVNGNVLSEQYSYEQKTLLQEEALMALLVKTGYDSIYINQRDVHWQTPLMHAALQNDEHSATLLFMYGADPRIKDIYGKSAREYAKGQLRDYMKGWEWQTLEMLRDSNNIWRLLRSGAHASLVTQALNNLNSHDVFLLRDSIGNTVLHCAIIHAYAGRIKESNALQEQVLNIISYAYDKCCDPFKDDFIDIQNNRGQTALMWATQLGYTTIVEWLLAHQADDTLRDKLGRTEADYKDIVPHKGELVTLLDE